MTSLTRESIMQLQGPALSRVVAERVWKWPVENGQYILPYNHRIDIDRYFPHCNWQQCHEAANRLTPEQRMRYANELISLVSNGTAALQGGYSDMSCSELNSFEMPILQFIAAIAEADCETRLRAMLLAVL